MHDGCGCGRPDYWILPFPIWTDFVQTIPKMYYDAYSQEQRLHTICKQLHKVICYADYLGKKVNITHDDVEKLLADFDKFKESGFIDYYEQQLNAWIDGHMAGIIAKYVKQVWFGLTLDGHFVAYIPEDGAWDDVIFDTGMVYGEDEYGRLMLRWNVDDSAERVNQRPEMWQ